MLYLVCKNQQNEITNMQAQHSKNSELVMPSKQDIGLAEKSGRTLAAAIEELKTPTFQIKDAGGKSHTVRLPLSAIKLLIDILVQMAEGNAVTLLPIHAELTTQEAADLLNVSRPHLVKLLDNKEIPFHKVGTHRRVLAEDVLQYKTNIDNERLKTLEELAKQAQDLKMGYDE
jgi:excisionase family DNA binding protein